MSQTGEQPARTLIVLRHAKAARPSGVADHDRPLNTVGIAEAELVGHRLAAAELVPDVALVSSALRTRQTWSAMASTWDASVVTGVRLVETRTLYEATADDVAAEIRTWGRSGTVVLVCGHEPVLSHLVRSLASADSDRRARTAVAERLRTGAAAVLSVSGEWGELAGGRLTRVFQPRD